MVYICIIVRSGVELAFKLTSQDDPGIFLDYTETIIASV